MITVTEIRGDTLGNICGFCQQPKVICIIANTNMFAFVHIEISLHMRVKYKVFQCSQCVLGYKSLKTEQFTKSMTQTSSYDPSGASGGLD